jgi:tetratricopeptide (TPR) repeat protein
MRQINDLRRQGLVAMQEGHDTQAEALFHHALALDHDSEALLRLAQIYDRHDRRTEAVQAYHTLIYSNEYRWSSISTDPNTHLRCVLALLRDGQWPQAVDIYNKAMNLTLLVDGQPIFEQQFDPESPDFFRLEAVAHVGLGITSQLCGPQDKPEQLKHLKAAVGLEPRWALAQYSYGKALAEAGRSAEAQTAYATAAKLGDNQMKSKVAEASRRLTMRQKVSRLPANH